MHILMDGSLSCKTDEQGILLTQGRGSKMSSETKVEIEKNNMKHLESCYGSWRLGNQ